MLVGDAVGLAYSQSGEGIRPAIESGLLAAKVIQESDLDFSLAKLDRYPQLLRERFGSTRGDWATAVGRKLSPGLLSSIARQLLRTRWFSQKVVVERWFLHMNELALRT
jgi:flavin-dependent dehydrogenase